MPDRICENCTQAKKERWGCETETKKPSVIMDGVPYLRCPNRPLLDDPAFFKEVFYFYNWYKKGHFPDEGTWLDQPNALVELITVIDGAVRDAENLEREHEQRRRAISERIASMGSGGKSGGGKSA